MRPPRASSLGALIDRASRSPLISSTTSAPVAVLVASDHRIDRIHARRIDRQRSAPMPRRERRGARRSVRSAITFQAPSARAIAIANNADGSASDHRRRRWCAMSSPPPGPERRVHGVPERLHDGRERRDGSLADDPDVRPPGPRRTPRTRHRCRRRGCCRLLADVRPAGPAGGAAVRTRRASLTATNAPDSHDDAPRARTASTVPGDLVSERHRHPRVIRPLVPTRSSRRCGGRSRRSRRRGRARAPLPRPDRDRDVLELGAGDGVRSCAERASCSP